MEQPTGITLLNEPLINHHEEEQLWQEVPPVGPGPRRSTRQPDRYQDFTLEDVEIEDALFQRRRDNVIYRNSTYNL